MQLVKKMELLEAEIVAAAQKKETEIQLLHPSNRESGLNLMHYLSLRSEDLRALQDELHVCGLSSLTSSESHVLRQVQAILERLGKQFPANVLSSCTYSRGRELISARAKQIFGSKKNPAIPYLMVTFDTNFAGDYELVKKLLEAGMNVARINCAHDGPGIWEQMIGMVRKATVQTGIPCKIYMDLAGPKMRTSILGAGRLAGKVVLAAGEEITLAEHDAGYDASGIVIGCDEPGIINQLRPGERVLFDDGLIECVVSGAGRGIAQLKITRLSGKKPQLKPGKGINFPDSLLVLPALTGNDRSILPFICEHADIAGYSFVRTTGDLRQLQEQLSTYPKRPGIIIKIETAAAVHNFPALLMQGMQEEFFGVMIARGDLAVEIGFERMSEIQEEILWISEAAHIPVIWATQVLESLNKSGIASRSEITDASYSGQSECVMINKGRYIFQVMQTLTDILGRSGGHHVKKRYTFRPMHIASDYFLEQ